MRQNNGKKISSLYKIFNINLGCGGKTTLKSVAISIQK